MYSLLVRYCKGLVLILPDFTDFVLVLPAAFLPTSQREPFLWLEHHYSFNLYSVPNSLPTTNPTFRQPAQVPWYQASCTGRTGGPDSRPIQTLAQTRESISPCPRTVVQTIAIIGVSWLWGYRTRIYPENNRSLPPLSYKTLLNCM